MTSIKARYKRTDRLRHGEKRRAKARENYKRYKADGRTRKWNLVEYGLTPESYKDLLQRQGEVCAICRGNNWGTRNGRPIAPSVDHCHKTGAVRGLLCLRCNKTIGAFGDDIVLLEAALCYLRDRNLEIL